MWSDDSALTRVREQLRQMPDEEWRDFWLVLNTAVMGRLARAAEFDFSQSQEPVVLGKTLETLGRLLPSTGVHDAAMWVCERAVDQVAWQGVLTNKQPRWDHLLYEYGKMALHAKRWDIGIPGVMDGARHVRETGAELPEWQDPYTFLVMQAWRPALVTVTRDLLPLVAKHLDHKGISFLELLEFLGDDANYLVGSLWCIGDHIRVWDLYHSSYSLRRIQDGIRGICVVFESLAARLAQMSKGGPPGQSGTLVSSLRSLLEGRVLWWKAFDARLSKTRHTARNAGPDRALVEALDKARRYKSGQSALCAAVTLRNSLAHRLELPIDLPPEHLIGIGPACLIASMIDMWDAAVSTGVVAPNRT